MERMHVMHVLDEYPSEAIHFDVQGHDVAINIDVLKKDKERCQALLTINQFILVTSFPNDNRL